ncbi:unnamed protein product [Eruca vesicaria subsp. sativa]|uniref:RING-type E3 ubiquitin transferase n=1 Tax=Eruca vesicaria subsp. sativa TaxID=29727 RepID=A0ABC8JDX4_ERUVS|nr:unnamed protein product [Eruca vesicaria subsp. sativa]
MKTRTCFVINLAEESPSSPKIKHKTESCTICQENSKMKKITLACGHEYHAECLEKWLIVKNLCPVCNQKHWPWRRETYNREKNDFFFNILGLFLYIYFFFIACMLSPC